MKKRKNILILSVVAIAFIALSGCGSEVADPTPSPKRETFTFRAMAYEQIGQTNTRTMLDGLTVKWMKNDECGLFQGTELNRKFINGSEDNLSDGTFTGELDPTQRKETLYAYYPYSASVNKNAEVLNITLPKEQTFLNNSFGYGANPAAAKGATGDKLQFKNLCGVIKVQLTGENIPLKSIEFIPHETRAVSGAATVNMSGDTPTLTMTASQKQGVKLVEINTTLDNTIKAFYIVLPVGEYAGFDLKLTNNLDKIITKSSQKILSVKRSTVTAMASLSIDFKFENAASNEDFTQEEWEW